MNLEQGFLVVVCSCINKYIIADISLTFPHTPALAEGDGKNPELQTQHHRGLCGLVTV